MKVALVGHSLIPKELEVPNAEVRVFRSPGAHVETFREDSRLSAVLSWKHDITLL